MEKKRQAGRIAAVFLCCALLVLPTAAYAQTLIPMGEAVGIRMETAGLLVSELAAVETAEGTVSPAKDAGLRVGDVICAVNGQETASAEDFLRAIAEGELPLTLTVLRDGTETERTVTPAVLADGTRQLGLCLRDGVTGVGTITYCDPETGEYGALGHGITDTETGTLMPLRTGSILRAEIADRKRGEAGKPGELLGSFDPGAARGSIAENTVFGIYGTMTELPAGEAVETAPADAVRTGEAVIRSTIDGDTVQDYTVEICRICHEGDTTRFQLTVTDPALLEATGGIVQGMSGSPILQDGKLVGAVTHVLVNDPTRGYGLFIENMLEAAA